MCLMRTLIDVQKLVPTSLETGLSKEGVEKSRQQYGANRLTPLPREPVWKKFLEKFDEPIIKVLLAAALLSMLVDLFKVNNLVGAISVGLLVAVVVAAFVLKKGAWIPSILYAAAILFFIVGLCLGHVLVEGLAVMVAVSLATGGAFWVEFKSDREFEALNAQKESLRSKAV